MQLALVRAWRHRAACADQRAPLGWVLAITRNEARRWHSRPAAREVPDEGAGARLAGSTPADEGALARLDVQRVVNRLPPDDRRLYALRYADDLTQTEIARRLSWPEGTVKVRLHRLRRRLATALGPEW